MLNGFSFKKNKLNQYKQVKNQSIQYKRVKTGQSSCSASALQQK